MGDMFFGCSSLSFLPYISKWNTSKVNNMSDIFRGCSSLLYLPDISKWNFSEVKDIYDIFYQNHSFENYFSLLNYIRKIKKKLHNIIAIFN